MKICAIRDKERQKPLGYLFCYEKAKEYIVELEDDLDEWDAPLLFQKYVQERVYTIPKSVTRLWVEERVIPSGRQNIGSILKNAKLKEYNEMVLLLLSKGKCSQDSCYLEEISYKDIPDKIKKRRIRNIEECFASGGGSVVCMFCDGVVRKISLKKLEADFGEIVHVLKNKALLETVKVGIGGYSISFNNSIEIPAAVLRDEQYEEPLRVEDFRNYVRNNIADTTKVCELMDCSRQNISYLVNVEKLEPIVNGTKEKWFTLGSVERVISE